MKYRYFIIQFIFNILIFISIFPTIIKAETYQQNDKPLRIKISNKYNFISFLYFHISEVIGDKSKFDILPCTTLKKILFFPKNKIKEKMSLSFISNIGIVQDVIFTVEDIEPTNIQIEILSFNKILSVMKEEEDHNDDNTFIITKFLHNIMSNKVQLKTVKSQIVSLRNINLRYKLIGYFIHNNFKAFLYDLQNTSFFTKNFTEDDLKEIFNGTKIYLPEQYLKAKGKMQILVIEELK